MTTVGLMAIASLTSCDDILGQTDRPTKADVTETTPGTLTGEFSVSASQKVKFSQGNLQATYDGSAWTWAFAEHQYDFIGNAACNTKVNGNGTISETGTVDLFGWVGASNTTWTGAAQYGICKDNTYPATANTYGDNPNDVLKADWGTLPISNGGNKANSGWRTLSKDEWVWLIGPEENAAPGTNCRTSSTIGHVANARWVKAEVHSVKGLIIFPDAFTWDESTMGVAPTTINVLNNNFTYNSLTDAQWTSLETAGCVFLPGSGFRSGTMVVFSGDDGDYWSSSISTTDPTSCYYLNFFSGSVNPAEAYYRDSGFSVRLVR